MKDVTNDEIIEKHDVFGDHSEEAKTPVLDLDQQKMAQEIFESMDDHIAHTSTET